MGRLHYYTFPWPWCWQTHHLQRDLDLVDQVILLPVVQTVNLLSHYKNNIGRNRVWTLERKHRLNQCVLFWFVHVIMWVHWNRSADVRSSSSHGPETFSLPGVSYSPDPPDKFGGCDLTATFIQSFLQRYHNYCTAELASDRCRLVVGDFHLISFFGENDFCAFFPSRFHMYCQDFVPDTGCKSICIHNLLKKINVVFF